MKPADWRDRQEGVCYMTGHDFTSNSGCAWMNPNGTITLIVHGNTNYTCVSGNRRTDMIVWRITGKMPTTQSLSGYSNPSAVPRAG
jgi:hypothetical protein